MWVRANELRLGDWVIDSYDYHLWEVVGVGDDRVELGHPFEHFTHPLQVLFIGDYKFIIVEEIKR